MQIFVSGRPSLDLLGTLKWRRDDTEELLITPTDVRDWFAGSSLKLAVAVDDTAPGRVRDVREALYRALAAVRAGRPASRSDVGLLNRVAASGGPELRLTTAGSVRRTATVDQALAAVVRDGFDVLDGGDLLRVRDCANPRCTRLFIDTSRGGTRRWCGMAECGNAAKVAAFRTRNREPLARH